MRNIGVESSATVFAFFRPVFVKPGSAFAAESRTKVVLGGTAGTAICQLAAGHRDKRTARSLDNLQISNDNAAIECD
jgi:hypothetical protein